jgi:hypothetical protein
MRDRAIATLILLDCMHMLTWDDDNQCRLTVPADIARDRDFLEDRPTIVAVLRRASAFKQQLAVPSADPFVKARAPSRADRFGGRGAVLCPSCRAKMLVGEKGFRCDLCEVAADIALLEVDRIKQQVERQRALQSNRGNREEVT